jgi:hypothetical protein
MMSPSVRGIVAPPAPPVPEAARNWVSELGVDGREPVWHPAPQEGQSANREELRVGGNSNRELRAEEQG